MVFLLFSSMVDKPECIYSDDLSALSNIQVTGPKPELMEDGTENSTSSCLSFCKVSFQKMDLRLFHLAVYVYKAELSEKLSYAYFL